MDIIYGIGAQFWRDISSGYFKTPKKVTPQSMARVIGDPGHHTEY